MNEKHYLLWTKTSESTGKVYEYCYLTLYDDGRWYTTRTGKDEYKCQQTPEGLKEAVELWFKVEFQYAELNMLEFLRQMGVKL